MSSDSVPPPDPFHRSGFEPVDLGDDPSSRGVVDALRRAFAEDGDKATDRLGIALYDAVSVGWITEADEFAFLDWLRERGWILNNPAPIQRYGLKFDPLAETTLVSAEEAHLAGPWQRDPKWSADQMKPYRDPPPAFVRVEEFDTHDSAWKEEWRTAAQREDESEMTAGEGVSPARRLAEEVAAADGRTLPSVAGTGNGGPSISTKLVTLAKSRYRFGCTPEGKLFAVPVTGGWARAFKGGSSALRSEVAKAYRDTFGSVPNAGALNDAFEVLKGEALDMPPTKLALRVARLDGNVIIDLGDETGRVVEVTPAGWNVLDRSPVLFRRTPLTGVLPVPVEHKIESRNDLLDALDGLEELRGILNFAEDQWAPVVAWLIAGFIEDLPHAVLSLSGQQGSAKSEAARTLVSLLDPSSVPLRSIPRDENDWSVAADAAWVTALDNVSGIPIWLSDALCKASTGDGRATRELYSDDGIAARSFRRVVILTSINFGVPRGDLAERLLALDLRVISDDNRRTEEEVLGSLLTLLSGVLHALPEIRLERMPRMADFARVLAAVDEIAPELGALTSYERMTQQVNAALVEADPVANAIVSMVRRCEGGHWEGTASDLMLAIGPFQGTTRPQDWVRTPHATANAARRVLPALRSVGVVGEQIQNRRSTPTWVFDAEEFEVVAEGAVDWMAIRAAGGS
jgi:hypothetical protein